MNISLMSTSIDLSQFLLVEDLVAMPKFSKTKPSERSFFIIAPE